MYHDLSEETNNEHKGKGRTRENAKGVGTDLNGRLESIMEKEVGPTITSY